MLVASEPGNGIFGQILGSVVTTMEADIDTFAGAIDYIIAAAGLAHWDTTGIYPIGYTIRLAIELLERAHGHEQ